MTGGHIGPISRCRFGLQKRWVTKVFHCTIGQPCDDAFFCVEILMINGSASNVFFLDIDMVEIRQVELDQLSKSF